MRRGCGFRRWRGGGVAWCWCGVSRVSKVLRDNTSHSRLEKNDAAAALSKHDPTRPMDWRIPSWVQSFVVSVAV